MRSSFTGFPLHVAMLLLFLISRKWTLTLRVCLTSLHRFQALRVGLISMSSLLFVMLRSDRMLLRNAALIRLRNGTQMAQQVRHLCLDRYLLPHWTRAPSCRHRCPAASRSSAGTLISYQSYLRNTGTPCSVQPSLHNPCCRHEVPKH